VTASGEIERKPTSGQNKSDDVRRTSIEIDKKPSLALRSRERRQDPLHSKNTYVPAIHVSQNRFVSRETRASAHRAPSPAPRTNPARPCQSLGRTFQYCRSPVSLQGLIEVLQHFYQRLVLPAPLAIKPPTPAPSPPSADHIPPPSHSINRKNAQPTRTLRPRKQTEKKNAVRHGRVQKRDPGGSSKGKECSPRKIYTRSCKKAAT
jgi:hypothetical protein